MAIVNRVPRCMRERGPRIYVATRIAPSRSGTELLRGLGRREPSTKLPFWPQLRTKVADHARQDAVIGVAFGQTLEFFRQVCEHRLLGSRRKLHLSPVLQQVALPIGSMRSLLRRCAFKHVSGCHGQLARIIQHLAAMLQSMNRR